MVASRPILSEIQPNSGRAAPFATLSTISATVSVVPPRRTTVLATPKSEAIGAICAVAIRPLAETITNITYISQNTGLWSTSAGE